MRLSFYHTIPMTIALICLIFTVLFSGTLMAKAWSSFKSNPDYTADYPDNWYRTDPSSKHFNVNSTEAHAGDTPANLQIRTSELTDQEAAMPWREFVDWQLEKHARYLDDNWIENPIIHPADTLAVEGANLGFHLRTDMPEGGEAAVLITDYARKGNKLFIFRFYCPLAKYEKYLPDYYSMRAGFKLR